MKKYAKLVSAFILIFSLSGIAQEQTPPVVKEDVQNKTKQVQILSDASQNHDESTVRNHSVSDVERQKTKNMFIEYSSIYDFEQTMEKLSTEILNGGWKISVTHDLQGTLNKSGIEVLPVKVIELCNPKLASQILKGSDTRIYSSMLPCRISVYQKEDGKTYISMINSQAMASQIGGIVEKVMNDAFLQADKFIKVVTTK